MRLRTLDLFCGGGGSSWGAQAAGAEIVCGVDSSGIAAETFQTNFPKAKTVNITLDENSTPASIGLSSEIELILSSPECTNHTCAKGGRARDEGSKRTALYILNFARELKPRWIVLENVIHMRSWHGYAPLVADLEGLGYSVRPQVLDASHFGVPQTRKRLFLLCDREGMPPEVRYPETSLKPASSILDSEGTWNCTPLDNGKRAKGTLVRAERAIKALGRGIPFLIVYYGSDGSGGWQPLDRPLRTLTTLDRFGLVTWAGDIPMLRMLQVPELQRAMGFNQAFVLNKGSRRDRVRLLGNGVCPPVMGAIIQTLVGATTTTTISKTKYKPNGKNQSKAVVPMESLSLPNALSISESSTDGLAHDRLRKTLDLVKRQAGKKTMSTDEIITDLRKLARA